MGNVEKGTIIRRNCNNNLCVKYNHLFIDKRGKWNIEYNSLTDSYNKYVIKNDFGCWGWGGKIDRYARLNYRTKMYSAHRVSYMIHNGIIPDKLNILHKCNNKVCTNPAHLYAGSNRDNMNDVISANFNYKNLKDKDIIKIKSLAKQNIKHNKIAEIFALNVKTVLLIIHNRFPFEKYKDLEF